MEFTEKQLQVITELIDFHSCGSQDVAYGQETEEQGKQYLREMLEIRNMIASSQVANKGLNLKDRYNITTKDTMTLAFGRDNSVRLVRISNIQTQLLLALDQEAQIGFAQLLNIYSEYKDEQLIAYVFDSEVANDVDELEQFKETINEVLNR